MLNLTYFYREPRKTGFSMEGIFHTVKKSLAGKVNITEFYCDPKASRLKNIQNAKKHSGELNHITGDVNFLALGLKGKKNILTVHDLGYYENPVHNKITKAIYHTFWYYLPLKYIDRVTVVSEFTKQKLIKYFHYPEHKIVVIPNPVKSLFQFSEKKACSVKPVVLMMGTGKHKNLMNLIHAATLTDIHIDIIGWPNQDEISKLKENNLSYSIYNGLTDEEVYQRYISCDILYNASFYEGFGMPIIEAQAVGRPVITSNVGAMMEVGKDSALLVDPNMPEETKNAIISLLNHDFYSETVKKGRQNAAKYHYDYIADQYFRLYQELAHNQ